MLPEVLDNLMISETKLDYSFLEQQFHIEGFNILFRLDRNRYGGGLLLYLCNDIIGVPLKGYVFSDSIEAFSIEILLKSCKWLKCCSYNPNRIRVATHLGEIGKTLDTCSAKYENTMLMDDFNVEFAETNMKVFCNKYNLKSLNKEITCLKNVDKPSCIDLFLASGLKCFEDCLTLEADLPDFQILIVTIMKTKHRRFPPKTVKYRDYKNFDTKVLKNRLELLLKNTTSVEELEEALWNLLNKFAPLKCKYLKANHSKFMTKELK